MIKNTSTCNDSMSNYKNIVNLLKNPMNKGEKFKISFKERVKVFGSQSSANRF